jgi:hypothetical protein
MNKDGKRCVASVKNRQPENNFEKGRGGDDRKQCSTMQQKETHHDPRHPLPHTTHQITFSCAFPKKKGYQAASRQSQT